MFAEGNELILGDYFPSFGGNFFSENMKLNVAIRHFICYEAEINESEPQKNFSKMTHNL